MADLNAFDSDGNCANFYPVETPKNEKIDEGDALFIAYLLTRHKPRRKQKAVKGLYPNGYKNDENGVKAPDRV
jgi:hypothetical protein